MKKSKGFTIIELMFATVVFSVVLLICSFALLQIGRTYYKGVTASKTQENSRSVIDEISRGIQFSGSSIAPTIGGSSVFCIGDQRYSYKLNQQVEDNSPFSTHQGYHALVVDSFPGCNSGTPSQDLNSNSISGRELLGQHMRLNKLSVTQVTDQTNLYNISIRVVYGDDDLLCSPSANDCSSSTTSTNLENTDITCKSIRAGTQFCAVSELNTVVQKRL